MLIFLAVLLFLSLLANAFQWHKWHSYRARPAGVHSHTGMMAAVRPTQRPLVGPRKR